MKLVSSVAKISQRFMPNAVLQPASASPSMVAHYQSLLVYTEGHLYSVPLNSDDSDGKELKELKTVERTAERFPRRHMFCENAPNDPFVFSVGQVPPCMAYHAASNDANWRPRCAPCAVCA